MNTVISETFLPEQEEWLEIFNTLGDIMFTLDCYGHVLLANEKALFFIEKEMHEIYGQGFEELCVCFGIHPRLNFVSRALSASTPAEEHCFSEGKNRWFKCTVYPPKSDATPAVVRFVDVTAEYGNLRRIKMLSEIIEQLNEGVCLTDAQGSILYANHAKCNMSGFDAAHELNDREFALFLSDENPAELCAEILKGSLKDGWRGDVIFKKKNGESYPGYLSTTPLRDVDGSVSHIVGVCHDTSEQKVMQEKLSHTAKLSALSSLVSGVAHEINNPLSTILGFSELALMRDKQDPRLKDDLIEIQIAAQRVHKIVKGFLTFSRRQTVQREMQDINALLEEMLSVIQYDFKINNILIETQFSEALPCFYGDKQQMHQVFVNLLTNAKHAVEEGGGERRVGVQTLCEDGKIKVFVKDTGAGIPEKNRARLFEPFFTTKGAGKGTGLGLSVSLGIVTQHGGCVYLTEDEGWSTVFCVEFPVPVNGAADEVEALLADGSVEIAPRQDGFAGKQVLVVDDEEQIRMMLREWLVGMGCKVELAEDGDKAIQKIKKREYDGIICDMRMPNGRGEDVYVFLEEKFPHLTRKLLFSTGDVVNGSTRDFLEEKNCAYLEKPFLFGEFMEKVSVILKYGASM